MLLRHVSMLTDGGEQKEIPLQFNTKWQQLMKRCIILQTLQENIQPHYDGVVLQLFYDCQCPAVNVT